MHVLRPRRVAGALVALAAACLARTAPADLDTQLLNGNQVAGTFLPAGETETYRVFLPRGSKLNAAAAGKKSKGVPAPKVQMEVVVPEGDPAAKVKVTGTGAKVTGFQAASSGEHAFRLTAPAAGNFSFSVKWKSPGGTRKTPHVFEVGEELTIPIAAEAGSVVTITAAASKGSASIPRITYVESADSEWFSDPFDEPEDFEAQKHTVAGLVLGGAGGEYVVHVDEAGGDGGAAVVSVTIKPPKSKPRKLDLGTALTGADPVSQYAKGAVLGAAGGEIEVGTDAGSLIDGASLSVPPGALSNPVVIVMSTANSINPGPNVQPAGGGVNFSPDGLVFETSTNGEKVIATIPFDPAKFAGDFSALEIYVQDADGNTSLVTPTDEYEIDPVAGTVSFPVAHFSTYQVFGPVVPKARDLNGDGFDDLVVQASAADGGRGRVYVFFGGAGFAPTSSADADVTLAGKAPGERFGTSVAVGDVNGDGIADLIVGAPQAAGGGRVDVFPGGQGFGPQTVPASFDGGGGPGAFGTVVLAADVTGDGVADVVASDPAFSDVEVPQQGAVYVIPGATPFEGGSALDDGVFALYGGFADVRLGISLAAGRLVGDDSVDLAIGAADGSAGDGVGAAYVVTGGTALATGYVGEFGPHYDGEAPGDAFGAAVAVLDADADGNDDLVVGAPGADVHVVEPASTVVDAGQVYVFLGPDDVGGNAAVADLEALAAPSADGRRGRALVAGRFYGNSVRGLATGLPGLDGDSGPDVGRISLQRAGADFAVVIDVAAGPEPGAEYGTLFTIPADLDDNGRDDLGAAAPGAHGGDGLVTVFFGPGLFGPKTVLIAGRQGERLGE